MHILTHAHMFYTLQLGAVYKGRPANGEGGGGGFEISDIPGRGEGGWFKNPRFWRTSFVDGPLHIGPVCNV